MPGAVSAPFFSLFSTPGTGPEKGKNASGKFPRKGTKRAPVWDGKPAVFYPLPAPDFPRFSLKKGCVSRRKTARIPTGKRSGSVPETGVNSSGKSIAMTPRKTSRNAPEPGFFSPLHPLPGPLPPSGERLKNRRSGAGFRRPLCPRCKPARKGLSTLVRPVVNCLEFHCQPLRVFKLYA